MTEKKRDELITQIKDNESDFIKFIYERLGIVIKTHQTHELHKTILNAYHKFNEEPKEYLDKLRDCQDHSPLLEHLISGVTVGETYFFRDKHQINLLKDKILIDIIQRKREENNLSLRIWSAGSATGEEIYTITMLLHELIPDIDKWRLSLLATDINMESLKKGVAGLYGEWSMRSIQDYFKRRYFTQFNKEYSFSQQLKELVHFDYLNLNEDTYPDIFNATNAQDLILCRNVFIYFDADKITHIMKKLNACLMPGGYLLLGASDPVNITGTDFIFHHHDGLVFTRPQTNDQPIKIIKTIATEKMEPVPPVCEKIDKKVIAKPEPISNHLDQDKITEMLQSTNWQEIINMIDQTILNDSNASFLLSIKATALANLGKLSEAERICQSSLALHSTNKDMYFTYALILIELNQLTEAEKLLRKTLFLDHQFVPAHFQLGLLLLRNKQHEVGLKSLRNALVIAKSKDTQEEVAGSHGLRYGQLVIMLKHEIEIHTSSGNINYVDQNA